MREIKFRSWNESQKHMAYQGTPDLETLQSFIHHYGDQILMQFTEITDSTGRDIYEGDVVLLVQPGRKYVVKFHKGCFKLFHADPKFNNLLWGCIDRVEELLWTIEVIGNIYENPDLLK